MHKLKSPTKKAAHAGGQAAQRNGQLGVRYSPCQGSSTKFLPQIRKIPPKSANRFEQRRQQLIQGLLAASSPGERRSIKRGLAEGRKLCQELEALNV